MADKDKDEDAEAFNQAVKAQVEAGHALPSIYVNKVALAATGGAGVTKLVFLEVYDDDARGIKLMAARAVITLPIIELLGLRDMITRMEQEAIRTIAIPGHVEDEDGAG